MKINRTAQILPAGTDAKLRHLNRVQVSGLRNQSPHNRLFARLGSASAGLRSSTDRFGTHEDFVRSRNSKTHSLRVKPDKAVSNLVLKMPKTLYVEELPGIPFIRQKSPFSFRGYQEVFGLIRHLALAHDNDDEVVKVEKCFEEAINKNDRQGALKMALVLTHIYSRPIENADDTSFETLSERHFCTLRRKALMEWVKDKLSHGVVFETKRRSNEILKNIRHIVRWLVAQRNKEWDVAMKNDFLYRMVNLTNQKAGMIPDFSEEP